jgi:hypothetical protein
LLDALSGGAKKCHIIDALVSSCQDMASNYLGHDVKEASSVLGGRRAFRLAAK